MASIEKIETEVGGVLELVTPIYEACSQCSQ
jgi:hypothetical protein